MYIYIYTHKYVYSHSTTFAANVLLIAPTMFERTPQLGHT